MELRDTQADRQTWNEWVSGFSNARPFHSAEWLMMQERVGHGRALFLEVVNGGTQVGLCPALLARRGPFLILGSPLPGTKTIRMGPLVAPGVDSLELGQALLEYGRHNGLSQIELCGDALESQELRALGFASEERRTWLLDLRRTEQELWRALFKGRRWGVNKARKNGLQALISHDAGLIPELYQMTVTTYARRGMKPLMSRQELEVAWQILLPAGLAQAWFIKDPEGANLAGGVFLHDRQRVYYWLGAAHARGYELAAHDLLHWEVIRWAQAQGIAEYDLYGAGMAGTDEFKSSFRPDVVSYTWWSCSLTAAARAARAAYKWWALRHGGSGHTGDGGAGNG